VHGAAQLASAAANGAAAAQHFANGVRTPAVLAAMNAGRASHNALAAIVQHAQQGHPQANQIVNALKMFKAPSLPARPALPFHFA
jgi:hypothetical protein